MSLPANALPDLFADPPAEYRPMPFFVWNGEVTEARVAEMIESFHAQGCGGAFVHPRPGLITEYLSERFFEVWGFALRHAGGLGMQLNIYDEDGFPSIYAGGEVYRRLPWAADSHLQAVRYAAPPSHDPQLWGALAVDEAGAVSLVAPDALDEALATGRDVFGLEFDLAKPTARFAWMPMPDTLRREVTDAFIDVTHEQYARRFGEQFGAAIRYCFTDEPGYHAGRGKLPMSLPLLHAFRRRTGYDLRERLADLFADTPTAPATRFDYYATLDHLFCENFARPIGEWCAAHGLDFTGHYIENVWPAPRSVADSMSAYRFMQAPGIDLLGFQYVHGDDRTNALYLLTIKEVRSVANQLGRDRVLCESTGGFGYDWTPQQSYHLVNYQTIHGINLDVPHLAHQTLAGARKYEWPHTYTDHSPWWADYRGQCDHQSRLNVALAAGEERNRTLLLHPTTTGWVHYNPLDTPARKGQAPGEALQALREDQAALCQALVDQAIDYDLGDEILLREHGDVDDRRLRVDRRAYDVVVLPGRMENLCSSTVALLGRYLDAGGTVLAVGTAPWRVDGRPSDDAAHLDEHGRWRSFADAHALLTELRSLLPPRATRADGSPLGPGLAHTARFLDDGSTVHGIMNTADEPRRQAVALDGGTVVAMDTETGRLRRPDARAEEGKVAVDLDLAPGEVAVLWTDAPVETPPDKPAPIVVAQHRLQGPLDVRRTEPNVLALDYAHLEVAGERHENRCTTVLNRLLWQAHGFEKDVWEWNVQPRRTYAEMTFPPDSGFAVEYPLHLREDLAPEAMAGIELALERPSLYRLTVNGTEIDTARARRWFDEEFGKVLVGPALRTGENVLRIEAYPMRPHCEVMPAYVLGDFAAMPAERGFALASAGELTLGDWREMGLSHYAGSVQYRFEIEVPAPGGRVRLGVEDFDASALRLSVDGEALPPLLHAPWERTTAASVPAGTPEVCVEVVGNLRNLLGPHHIEGLPGPWSWHHAPDHQPPGEAYIRRPAGLYAPPAVDIVRSSRP